MLETGDGNGASLDSVRIRMESATRVVCSMEPRGRCASEADMRETAEVMPLMPSDEAPAAGGMRYVLPLPGALTSRGTSGLLRGVAGECLAWVAVLAVAVVLLAPVIVFLVAGLGAVYVYIRVLLTLWHLVKSYQLTTLAPLLDMLNGAGRVALACAGYFALLAALIVLMAGLLGKRWRRLFLLPGTVFTIPSALAFFFGLRLSLDSMGAALGLSPQAQTFLTVYLLLDTILLAAALVDVTPRHRARRARRRRGASMPLAPVHFGPSEPLRERSSRGDIAPAAELETLSGVASEDRADTTAATTAVEMPLEPAPEVLSPVADAPVDEATPQEAPTASAPSEVTGGHALDAFSGEAELSDAVVPDPLETRRTRRTRPVARKKHRRKSPGRAARARQRVAHPQP